MATWRCSRSPTCGTAPYTKSPAPAQTAQRLAGATIAVTNKVAIDKVIFDAPEARDLKLIAVAATGTDIIDKEAAAERGVKVCNVPGYASQSVAQFTMTCSWSWPVAPAAMPPPSKPANGRRARFSRCLLFRISSCPGKKLGIIGYGNIGKTVAKMAARLRNGSFSRRPPGRPDPPGGSHAPLEELFRQADFISLHCPLTPDTQSLINQRTLALMKPSAFLINTARGALIDEPALIEALRAKSIAGAALDVITREPPPSDHPIVVAAKELDNLLVTPHTAWSSREARQRLLFEVKENILAFTQGSERNRIA